MAGSSSTDTSSAPKHDAHDAHEKSPLPPRNTTRPDLEEQNPFIAFRRYADEQISSMLHSVMGIPSMMASSDPDRWLQFDEENQRRFRRDEANASNSDVDRWDRGFWRPAHDEDFIGSLGFPLNPFSSFESLFDDRFPFGFGGFFSPDNAFFGGDSQAWPIPYLLFSPYSPLHLERSQARNRHQRGLISSIFSSQNGVDVDSSEPRWRDAFEDLLRVENGLAPLDRSTNPDSINQSANDWLRGLVQRGSLGNNWKLARPDDSRPGLALERSQQYGNSELQKARRETDAKEAKKDENMEPETELDLYDRFLSDITTAHEKYSRAFADSPLMRLLEEERKRHLGRQEEQKDSPTGKTDSKDWLEYTADGKQELLDTQLIGVQPSAEPRVLSTTTRTVRRTEPDGSISTKTIKSRRFADGREESDESVEVIPPPAKNNETKPISSDERKGNNNSSSGWFWTR